MTGKTPGARAMRRRRWVSTGVKFANGGLAAHDPRRSARGRRLNLPTCAHLYIYIYIHIYTSRFDSVALLHPLVVGGGGGDAAARDAEVVVRCYGLERMPEAAPSFRGKPPSAAARSDAWPLFSACASATSTSLDPLVYLYFLRRRWKRIRGGPEG